MADMSKFSPDNGLTILNIKDAVARSAQNVLLKDTVGWIGKNYLKLSNLITSAVSYMVTDGALSVFGTAGSNASNYYVYFDLPDGDYIFYTGYIPSDSSTTLSIFKVSQGSVAGELVVINNSSENNYIPFTVDHDGYDSLQFRIWNRKETTYNYTCYPMVCKAEVFNGTFEPYHESADEYLASKGLLEGTVGWIGKNLLKYPYTDTTKTDHQVTFTDNGDGSITINGTASGGNAYFTFFGASGSTEKIIPPGKYKITSNGLGDNIQIMPVYKTIGYSNLDNVDAVDGLSYMVVRVPNGKTVDNVTIHPMIRDASITDDTYEPYHKTVEEMFDDLGIASVTGSSKLVESGAVKDIVGWGNKNLLPYPYTTGSITKNGITWTVNPDGSVTANGTATANSTFSLYEKEDINFSGLKISCCPNGGSESTYFAGVALYNSPYTRLANDVGEGADIPNYTQKVMVYIRISNGVTVSNLTFYPMISADGGAYEPYHKSVEEYCASKQDVKDIIGWAVSKNLCNPNLFSWGLLNVSTGELDTRITDWITSNYIDISSITEQIKIQGWRDGTEENLCVRLCWYNASKGYISGIQNVSTGGNTFVASYDKVENAKYIRITVGFRNKPTTVNSFFATNRVQVCDSIYDNTYEPYHASVEDTLRDAEVVEGKNLLPCNIDFIKANNTHGTWNGNTFTYRNCSFVFEVDDYGYVLSITKINPTPASMDAYMNIGSFTFVSTESYIMTGGINSNSYIVLQGEPSKKDEGNGLNINNYSATNKMVQIVAKIADTTTRVFYPMIRKATETDPTYEPYYVPLKDAKLSYADNGVLGAKNQFDLSDSNKRTESAEYAYTDTGIRVYTSVAGLNKFVSFWLTNLNKNTDYVLKCKTQVTSGKGNILIRDNSTSTNVKEVSVLSTGEYEVTFNTGNYTSLFVNLYCTLTTSELGDITYNDIIIKLATDSDPTYQPYAQTNRELTVNKCDNSVIGPVEGANASKAWSVGEHFISGGQFKEITNAIASGEAINSGNTTDKPIAELLDLKKTKLTLDLTYVTAQDINVVRKVGHICTFNLICNVTTTEAWQNFAELPTGYRPTENIVVVGRYGDTFMRFYVNSNGKINCYTNISGVIGLSVTFIID